MASDPDAPTPKRRVLAPVREAVDRGSIVMLFTGVLAGYSLTVLGTDAVVVPLVGSLPGTLVGAAGIVVAFGVYRRSSCCDDCGEKECRCAGTCGDSCSYDG